MTREEIIRRLGDIRNWQYGNYEQYAGSEYEPDAHTVKEAIDLLKADAPRVLTLEELMGFDGAFLIEYNKSLVSLNPTWATFHFMDEKWVFLYKDVVIAHYSVEQYGRTWRCWSRRPDREQMEATPWPSA